MRASARRSASAVSSAAASTAARLIWATRRLASLCGRGRPCSAGSVMGAGYGRGRSEAISSAPMQADRRYEPKQIEPRWQEVWERERTWEVANAPETGHPKSYVLEMLPYPSGEPHMGHLKNYAIGDA